MDRRNFLQTVTICGVAATIPAAASCNLRPMERWEKIGGPIIPIIAGWRPVRMSQLNVGDYFRFADEPKEIWTATSQPYYSEDDDAMGIEAKEIRVAHSNWPEGYLYKEKVITNNYG